MDKLTKHFKEVHSELLAANAKFPAFVSPHEGAAIIREEFDEFWDEVKRNATRARMKEEAIQLAAMAIKFVDSLCE